jgi:hypothetical protein
VAAPEVGRIADSAEIDGVTCGRFGRQNPGGPGMMKASRRFTAYKNAGKSLIARALAVKVICLPSRLV